MKKSILNLGKTLNKTEQKTINGGSIKFCTKTGICGPFQVCQSFSNGVAVSISINII